MQFQKSRSYALVLTVASLCSAQDVRAQSMIRELYGRTADEFGTSVAQVEDLDGDGLGDIVVGSPGSVSALGNVRAFSGADGRELWQVNGTLAGARFGLAIAGVGDVNGDGRGDVLVGAHLMSFAGASGAGEVRVLSGVGGALVRSHRGDSAGDHFGWSVADAGDLDLDGVSDYVVGAIDDDNTGSSSGSARAFSGASGAVLFTVNGTAAQQVYGYSLAAAGDVNGDGRGDVVVGGPYFASSLAPGMARVHSGLLGTVLWSWTGDAPRDSFGVAVAGVGDVDGDSIADVLVGARQLASGTRGYARVLSGATGLIVHHIAGASTDLRFGSSLAPAGDVDYDGRGDFLVGTPDAFDAGTRSGAARLFSGALANVLLDLRGTAAGMRIGSSLAGGLDLTGERGPDLLVGSPGNTSAGTAAGATFAFTGNDAPPPSDAIPLTGDVAELSRSARDSQHLALDAGSEHAGLRYRMLGSMSGVSPGVAVGELTLPLNPDRYMHYLLHLPPRGPLCWGSGLLDEDGRASATFTPLRQWAAASVVGRTFHHAYVVYASDGRPLFVSNAVAVTLLP